MDQTEQDRYTLIYCVPPSHLEATKEAIFAAGAGNWNDGQYIKVCSETKVMGQFQPGEGANPHIGTVNVLERLEEIRVETICRGRDVMQKVIDALKQ